MMKVKDAFKLLRKNGCKQIRSNAHFIWERPDGRKMAVPNKISKAVERKIFKFINGENNYHRS